MRDNENFTMKLVVSVVLYHSCVEVQTETEHKSYCEVRDEFWTLNARKAKLALDPSAAKRRNPPSVGVNRLKPPMDWLPGSSGRWVIRKAAGKQVQVVLIRFAV